MKLKNILMAGSGLLILALGSKSLNAFTPPEAQPTIVDVQATSDPLAFDILLSNGQRAGPLTTDKPATREQLIKELAEGMPAIGNDGTRFFLKLGAALTSVPAASQVPTPGHANVAGSPEAAQGQLNTIFQNAPVAGAHSAVAPVEPVGDPHFPSFDIDLPNSKYRAPRAQVLDPQAAGGTGSSSQPGLGQTILGGAAKVVASGGSKGGEFFHIFGLLGGLLGLGSGGQNSVFGLSNFFGSFFKIGMIGLLIGLAVGAVQALGGDKK